MTQSSVQRSYMTGTMICAALYVALVLGAKLAIRHFELHGLALEALAVLPTAPIVAFFFVFARYLRDVDEYRRHRTVNALLVSLAIGLSIACGWDFLQAYGHMTGPEPFIVSTGFMLLFGVVQGVMQAIDHWGRPS